MNRDVSNTYTYARNSYGVRSFARRYGSKRIPEASVKSNGNEQNLAMFAVNPQKMNSSPLKND